MDAQNAEIVWEATEVVNQTANKEAPVTDTDTPTPKIETKEVSKDKDSAIRYQISRERERRIEAEKKLAELLAKSKEQQPKFDEVTDPDWTKEIDYKIQKWIDDWVLNALDKLWVKETLTQLQYEREQEKFFEVVEQSTSKFKDLWIDTPSKEELIKTLDVIDKKGITPEQLIAITKLDSILSSIKKPTFTPWDWGKPNVERPLTQEEINANIYKKHWVFQK
jgi:hypothetical protein